MPSAPPPSRDGVVRLLCGERRALHVAEIAGRLGLDPAQRAGLRELIEELVGDGVLVPRQGQRFRLAEQAAGERDRTLEGVVSVNARGFGFVKPDELGQDVYVPAVAIGPAMHRDRVVCRIVSRTRRGLEGEIVQVLARGRRRVAGLLRRSGRSAWLEPDDARVRGPIVVDPPAATDRTCARGGQAGGTAAVVEIERYPELAGELPQGRVVATLGVPGEPDVEVAKILGEHGIEEAFPPAVEDEVRAIREELAPADRGDREDLTDKPLLTIDPEDARDFDDAVWAERDDAGRYRAWIAVADVAWYVRPGTSLDAEALRRGNAVYLPDRAIPMLPARLAARLCSLLPGELRPCLCVEIELDAAAHPTGSRIFAGLMRSAARLTYPGVARALGLSHAAAREAEAERFAPGLGVMWDLARRLRRRRLGRGALDLDLPEPHIVVDNESRLPVAVRQRGLDPGVRQAYQLIEELMVLANETVAASAVNRGLGAIFRVHGPPDPDKLARFAAVATELGVPIEAGEELQPRQLSRLLRRIGTHPRRALLSTLLLRSLKQAIYDPVNIGHYGLASPAYLHFTSPIRRYPDLVMQRVVHAAPGPQMPPAEWLRTAARLSSEQERNAMEVERQVTDLYRALYMQARVGEEFEATAMGMSDAGVFARIEDPFVEVLVPMEELGAEPYVLDETGLRAVGRRSGGSIEVGDVLRVRIGSVSVLRRTVYASRVGPRGRSRRSSQTQPERRRDRRQDGRESGRGGRRRG
ncbi:MAG: VacB/RNase II family 3'-5' exoribonuclease [Deltaproteobacteria bacterium]|nr:VacB/RNase II family 3'-5' exoribonuclease [Deltaproteobacteria bacterium]